MRRIRQLTRALARAVGRLFFLVISLAVVLAGAGLLLRQLAAAEPDAGLISAAGGLMLIGALFARYGEDLATRIRKVGPVEIAEEIRETLATLEDIAEEVPEISIPEENTLKPVPLSPKQRFSYEQGDLYALMLMAMEKEPTQPEQQSRYFALLFKVGACAFGQKDWPRATARLGRLEKLSDGSYRQEDVAFYLGVAHCYWGMELTDAAECRRHFVAARDWLRGLARGGDPRHRTYFFLAYAQDELGHWHDAVRSNEEALKRRPRYAPAKYNRAISHLKLGSCRDAFRALEALTPSDEEIEHILAWYDKDEELLPRMSEAQWRRATERLMRDIVQRRRELARAERGGSA